MKKNFTFVLFLSVLLSFPVSSMAQVKLPTYATGAPIRPGNLSDDDRSELSQAGIVPHEDTDGRDRLAGQGDSPFHANPNKTTACATTNVLVTPYNTNNGQRGCMFDILATNTVTVICFDANLYSGTTADYEIYYRAGTHVGNENNAAAWTFLGGATAITSAGNNVPTALPIPVNVTIPAGARYSFYITNTFGGGTSYTDGAAVGNFLAGDPNITVYEGVGKSYPFGLTFTVRNFNGHIFYNLGGSLDANEAVLHATARVDGVDLSWEIGEDVAYQTAFLERSLDGDRFDELARWEHTQNTSSFKDADATAERYYYRLRMLDAQGTTTFSNVAEVLMSEAPSMALGTVFPNPFSRSLSFQLQCRHSGTLQIRLLNQLGQVVHHSAVEVDKGNNSLEMDLPELAAGMYTLSIQGRTTHLSRKIVRE